MCTRTHSRARKHAHARENSQWWASTWSGACQLLLPLQRQQLQLQQRHPVNCRILLTPVEGQWSMRGITWYHPISHWHHVMHIMRQLAWRTQKALSRHYGVNDIIWNHLMSDDVIWESYDSTCDGVRTLQRLCVIAWKNLVFWHHMISCDVMWCHVIWYDIMWQSSHWSLNKKRCIVIGWHNCAPIGYIIWYNIISCGVIWYNMIHSIGRRGQLPCQPMIIIWKLTSLYDVMWLSQVISYDISYTYHIIWYQII